jgi:23S rRNA (guanine745-N1)-methyltransferase
LLACTVRGCGLALARRGAALVCGRGHSFDVARSGFVNLLQPQDRRSLAAGDSREAVGARRELRRRGLGAELEAAQIEVAQAAALAQGAVAVDLGCGVGDHLAALAARFELAACGVDLSVHAIDAAARAYPGCTWLVANADRRLPFPDASVDLALSIDGRRPVAEIARIVKPGGWTLVAVPAPDDLAELRAAVLNDARPLPGLDPEIAELSPAFQLVERRTVRETIELDRAGLLALSSATYRLGRQRERDKLASLERLAVSAVHEVGLFRRSA